MSNLIRKELRLAMHPAAVMFLALSAMLMIPNYPYYVICFYTSLGIFFICLSGRENHDIFYSMTLPVSRRDIAGARMLTCVMLEMIQLLLAIPFAYLRQKVMTEGNLVGMDANIAFFGGALMVYGIFNLVFFAEYYKNPEKVGIVFVKGTIAEWIVIIAAETLVHIIPFARDVLDTPDSVHVPEKLGFLAAGIVIYAALTYAAWKISAERFEKVDL